MNNFMYPLPNSYHQQILEQLSLINKRLNSIEQKLDNKNSKND